jgi:protein-tyrosine-phosphatase
VSDDLRLMAVCTRNRTRSVLIGALLQMHLDDAGLAARVRTAGFVERDMPPTRQTVAALAERGIDVSGHRSTTIDLGRVERSALVVTAERLHVIRLCADVPEAFERTFTLPELVARGESRGPVGGRPIGEWLAEVGAGRRRRDYVDDAIPEVDDPTGAPDPMFASAVVHIDELCGRLAALLAG